jgi:hypothetical protein
MLLQFLSLIVIYIISLSHYGAGKAVLITVLVGVTTFIMYFIFNMIGAMLSMMIIAPFRKEKHKKEGSANDVLKDLKKASSGVYEWRLPFCAIVSVFLALLIFNLFHVHDFLRALFYLTFAFYAFLSYLDRVFTHMPNKFIPTALETAIYLLVAISLFGIS